MTPGEYIIGLDLGKLRDSSALAVLHRYSVRTGRCPVRLLDLYEHRLVLRALERIPLRTSYPHVVDRVRDVVVRLASPIAPVTLIVDATGVGEPVMDLLRTLRLPCQLIGVRITGTGDAAHTGDIWTVPKEDLIVGLQLALARGEVTVAGGLPLKDELVKELTGVGRGGAAGE